MVRNILLFYNGATREHGWPELLHASVVWFIGGVLGVQADGFVKVANWMAGVAGSFADGSVVAEVFVKFALLAGEFRDRFFYL